MIICEGCDNTGKTTLIELLCRDIPELVRVPKSPGPAPRDEIMDYMNLYLSKTQADTLPMVFDRFSIPSEYVYSTALKRDIVLDTMDMVSSEARLSIHRPLIIFCDRPVDRILASFDDRDQLKGVRENIELIKKLYEEVWEKLGFSWFVRYDYEEPQDYGYVRNFVKEYLQKEGARVSRKRSL